ncbi:hypothetical protein Q7P35_009083 [Cladosporium inversicolor]
MPKPKELHHCKLCGPKGGARRARRAGLCKHKKPCKGTHALPHDPWFMGVDEDCKACEIVIDAADREEREQRERDEQEAEKLAETAWFKG